MPGYILTDSYRLIQIMLNLICNAVKFTSQGKITVSVEFLADIKQVGDKSFSPIPFDEEGLFEKDINFANFYGNKDHFIMGERLKLKRRQESIRTGRCGIFKITVQDTGPGLSDDEKQNLYKIFSQVSSGRLGTGLGLWRCPHFQ